MLVKNPHGEDFEVLEPADLDKLGLTPNVRNKAIADGKLAPWLTLRGGKFFLFLREDVEAYIRIRNRQNILLDKRMKEGNLTKEQSAALEALDRAFGAEIMLPAPKGRRSRA